MRQGHVIVPRGDTVVQPGDEILCLVTANGEEAINRILVA
jgi:Trk K+ transport system NAD-binding subunit